MDVVGPNKDFLFSLYSAHQQYLLDFDRPTMDETFGTDVLSRGTLDRF